VVAEALLRSGQLGARVIMAGRREARPAPGVVGRLYYVNDPGTECLCRDTGREWEHVRIAWTMVSGRPESLPAAPHTHTDYAALLHTHAPPDPVLLPHNHDALYALLAHGHANYAEVHGHPYAPTVHVHDYAATVHGHEYAALVHTHAYAAEGHVHPGYAAAVHGHNDYAIAGHAHVGYVAITDMRLSDARTPTAHAHPQDDVTGLSTALSGKADASHTHPSSSGLSGSRVVLTADVTNNNAVANTMQDVLGLSFPVVANTRTWFRFLIPYTAAAITTGSRWSINGPAVSFLAYRSEYGLTTTSRTANDGLAAYNLPALSNASSPATAGNLAEIEGIIVASASGTVVARFASEVASSAIVAKAGAYVEYGSLA